MKKSFFLKHKNIIIFSFLLLSLFSSCKNSSKKTKEQDFSADFIKDVKYTNFINEAENFLIQSKFQGSILVGKGKKIVYAQGFGTSDKKASDNPLNTIQSTYEIGSICKQMTAAAVMQLAEKKLLSVNDKLSKYFPDFKHGDEITIKLLLTMHSGLTDHINAADEFFPKKIYHKISRNEINNTPLDKNIVLDYLYTAPILTKPGKTYFYCNTDYYLLAKIVEIVSGMPFEEYMQQNIFDKCNMTASNQKFQGTTTKGYDYKKRYYSIPQSMAFGCGDVNSNVIDLFKWNTNFANGKVVSKKTFNEMTSSESYGYGVYCDKNDSSILHGGNTNVFNGYNVYYLNEKLSIIVLSNTPTTECNTTEIAGKLRKIWKNIENNTEN